MKDLESITQSLSVTLKKKGYKKSGLSWRKEKQLLTVFFSIEKSQYSTDTWYYWFGIYLHKLSEGKRQTIGNCQIKHRVDNVVNRVSEVAPKVVVPVASVTKDVVKDVTTTVDGVSKDWKLVCIIVAVVITIIAGLIAFIIRSIKRRG
jgi:hypothetical protein